MMMPRSSIFWNSFLAAASLSPIRRLGRANTGGPVVGTVWKIPWAGGVAGSYRDTRTLGNLSRRLSMDFDVEDGVRMPRRPPQKQRHPQQDEERK